MNIKKFVGIVFAFIFVVCINTQHVFAYSNLLTNPGAESASMTGWTVDNNGGDGWHTDWNGPGNSDGHVFSTSYNLDSRHQTIDLVAAGYTAEQLDSGTFSAKMSEWLYTRGDQGGQYYLKFELLAGDGTTVLDTYSRGSSGSLIQLSAGVPWFKESHTFSNIPEGTRYIRFEDGGRDQSNWAGNYGVNFDDASVVVSDTPIYDLLYTVSGGGSFVGTRSQTVSSGSDGTSITAVPNGGHYFINWSDDSTTAIRTDTGISSNLSLVATFGENPGPSISGMTVNQNLSGVTITWSTDTPGSSIVDYGLNEGYGSSTPETDTETRVTSHTVVLPSLAYCNTYHFRVRSFDQYEHVGTSSDGFFRTPGCMGMPLYVAQNNQQTNPVTSHANTTQESERTVFQFTKDLKTQMSDGDVKTLQIWLNNNGFVVSSNGPGSKGKENNYFGLKTKLALMKFQQAHAEEILIPQGLKKPNGLFGPSTRKVLNNLIQ